MEIISNNVPGFITLVVVAAAAAVVAVIRIVVNGCDGVDYNAYDTAAAVDDDVQASL